MTGADWLGAGIALALIVAIVAVGRRRDEWRD